MDNESIRKKLTETIDWDVDCTMKHWLDADGIVVSQGNMQTGAVIDPTPLIGDLGDYIQYIIYAGQILNRPKFVDWSIDQILRIARTYQNPSGMIEIKKSPGPVKIIHREDAGDTIVGLAGAYMLTRNEDVYKILDRYTDYWYREIVTNDNHVSLQLACSNMVVNIPYSHPAMTGNMAEECLLLFQFTQDEKYLVLARTILDRLLANHYFLAFRLFPIKFLTFTNSAAVTRVTDVLMGAAGRLVNRKIVSLFQTLVSKSNSNSASALTELVKLDREKYAAYERAMVEWAAAFRRCFYEDRIINNVFYHPYRPSSTLKTLAHVHPAINNLLDVAVLVNDAEMLGFCERCVEYLLDKISGIEVLPQYFDPDSPQCELDDNIDFSVVLFKLAETTGKREYHDRASRIIQNLVKYYPAPYGFASDIDRFNGTIVNYNSTLKFHTLALKGLCLLYQKLQGINIRDNRDLFCNTRDR